MGRCYPHLSLEERRKLAKWREAKMPVPKMAPPARVEAIVAGISDAQLRIVPAAHLSAVECPNDFAQIILSMAEKAQQRRDA